MCIRDRYELDLALARINIPSMLLDGGADCNKGLHSDILIDKYYSDIVSCINDSSINCTPGRKFHGNISEYVIPGWNEVVADKYSASRKALLDWVAAGKE